MEDDDDDDDDDDDVEEEDHATSHDHLIGDHTSTPFLGSRARSAQHGTPKET